MDFLVILGIIILLGALIGGKHFGDTVRKGFGCFVLLLVVLIGILIFNFSQTNEDSPPKEEFSSSKDYAYFIVKHNCETYTKPNKNSEISGYLDAGQEIYIENMNKFNYFYEVNEDNGRKS